MFKFMEEPAQGTPTALEHEPDTATQIREKATQASTLLQQGRIDEACSLANEAYEEGVRSIGSDHSSTLGAQSVLGAAITSQGRFQDGEGIGREVVGKCFELLGPDHVDTLRATNKLVVSLSYQFKCNEAYELIEATSRRADEALGVAHEHALRLKCQLMSVLLQRSSLQESARLGREVMERAQRVLDQNHLVTISALTTLCATLHSLERKDEALVVGSQAVQRSVAEHGNGHLASCNAKTALFSVLFETGQKDEASKMLAEAGRVIRQNQQPWYPDVLRVEIQWSRVLQYHGKVSEATTSMLETLRHTRQLQTGSNIWEAVAMQTLASLLYKREETRAHAQPIMNEAVAAMRRILGPGHETVQEMEKLLTLMEQTQKRSKEGPESLQLFDNLTKNRESYEVTTQVSEPAEPFKPVCESNAHRSKRDVYLKFRPLEGLVNKFQWGSMGELASLPSLAYWALEVRSSDMAQEDEGLTWALLPTADGEIDMRMEFGRWRDAVKTVPTGKKASYSIKSVRQKVGTSKATDVEIDGIATQVLDSLKAKQASQAVVQGETLEHVRTVLHILSTSTRDCEHEPTLPNNSNQAIQQCNLAFERSQNFAAQVAQRLCPDGFLRRNSARKALAALTTARKKAYVVLETAEPEEMYALRPIAQASREKGDGQDGVSLISTVLSPSSR